MSHTPSHHDQSVSDRSYIDLNAELNFYDENGRLRLEYDAEAARQYFLQYVNPNTVFFHDLEEKIDYLIDNDYYESEVIDAYQWSDIKALFRRAYDARFRFESFIGAMKFYTSYALRTRDGSRFLERYEDRVVLTAMFLAAGDIERAKTLVDEMISGRVQPATPTFLNAGRAQRGEHVSCFPAETKITMTNGVRKNIEDIEVGDEVVTHTGRARRVYKSITNNNTSSMVTIKPANSSPVTMTGNHPVLVWAEDFSDNSESLTDEGLPSDEYRWVEAKDVRVGKDYVLLPEQTRRGHHQDIDMMSYVSSLPLRRVSEEDERTLESYEYDESDGKIKYLLRDKKHSRKNDRKYSVRTSPVNRYIRVDGDLGRFMGYYLSEGYASSRHKDGIHNSVVFTFGSHEDDFVSDIVDLSKNIFGVVPKVNYNMVDHTAKVSVNSVLVAEMVYDMMGSGFDKKMLSPEMFHASDDFIRGVLMGAFRGDGCVHEDQMIMDLVNPAIIRQMHDLSISVGLTPGIRDYVNASGNTTSSLSMRGIHPGNKDFIYETGKNLSRFLEPRRPNRSFLIRSEEGVLSQVVGKSVSDPVDTVYNLEVEDDHSYLAEGVAVHNCFLLRTEDSMESITSVVSSALQLSKRGGGVGICLTNLRERGSAIKGIENAASGVVPVMKILEDCFSYANQLGARQGAGAVYISVCHPDVMAVMDTKRENADEKVRIKTLSLGLVIPDVAFDMARADRDLYQFSPADVEKVYGRPMSDVSISEHYHDMVEDSRIAKTKISARKLFQTIAELQFESGYPYLMFEDTVNTHNHIDGRVSMSNLCQIGSARLLTEYGYQRLDSLWRLGGEKEMGDEGVSAGSLTVWSDTRAINHVVSTDEPMTLRESTQVVRTARQADTFALTTTLGQRLVATAWHRFPVIRDGEVVEAPLSDLGVGDEILLQPGNPNALGGVGRHTEHDDLQRGQYHLAWLAGHLRGAGVFIEDGSPRWETEDDHAAEQITAAITDVLESMNDGRGTGEITSSVNWSGAHVISSPQMTEVLSRFGVDKDSHLDVSEFVWTAGDSVRWGYLDGMLSGAGSHDGHSVMIGLRNIVTLRQIQILLMSLDVVSHIDPDLNSAPLVIDDTYSLSVLESNTSWAPRMGVIGDQGAERALTTRVASIEYDGRQDVYDVAVPEGHSIFVDGLSTYQCSEILQVNTPATFSADGRQEIEGRDISCNLSSINITHAMKGPDFGDTVDTAIRALTQVSDHTSIEAVPSVRNGNEKSHSVGLGAMNLHGFLGSEKITYGSDEALDFVNVFFATMRYHALSASCAIAAERGETFYGFSDSEYASIDGAPSKALEPYTSGVWETTPHTPRVEQIFSDYQQWYPSVDDWKALDQRIAEHGLYNAYLMAVAPTGSISYINHATSSVHPIVSKIEIRKEGKIGRVYSSAPGMTNDTVEYFDDAYEIGYMPLINTYAVAQKHVDQGMSLTMFFRDSATTRDLNKAYIYAWSRGREKNEYGEPALWDPRTSWKSGFIKTLYYSRVRQTALAGTEVTAGGLECVSCTI